VKLKVSQTSKIPQNLRFSRLQKGILQTEKIVDFASFDFRQFFKYTKRKSFMGIIMFKIFGRKSKEKERDILEIGIQEPVDCLCDFTYNFYWQHKGEKLDPQWKIADTDFTFKDLVEHLKNGCSVKINGNAGHRLGSSMGADLKFFGGTGGEIDVGDIIVDGDVDTRMGISMVKGNIYVKGNVKEPIGNLAEVKSDMEGYKKFRSITDIVMNGLEKDKLEGSQLVNNGFIIGDKVVRDTVGSRLDKNAEIVVNGNVDLSTGILMRNGTVRVNGNAGKNTGALLNGGTVVINGNCDDFTGIDMIKGSIIVNGNAGKFLAANKKSGVIFAKTGSPIPPAEEKSLSSEDSAALLKYGFNPREFKKFE
jgi:formylmethanofuran dehydrogenase subunit C